MKIKEIEKNLTKYASYMDEIKWRIGIAKHIVDKMRGGKSYIGHAEPDIDIVYLQLQKSIELVMFACIVGRSTAGDRLNKILRKGYVLTKLKRELASLNIDYFPKPKYDKDDKKLQARSVGELKEIGVPISSDADLLSAYGRAGNYLHAQRESKYGDNNTKAKIMNRAAEDLNNLISLLNHHWIKISDDVYFAVIMHGESDGKVYVTLLKKV